MRPGGGRPSPTEKLTESAGGCGSATAGGKKKVCKDCTCGLADEEDEAHAGDAVADQSAKKPKATNQAKSSCGNVRRATAALAR